MHTDAYGAMSFEQWSKLVLIRHRIELRSAPVDLGLLDALRSGRGEVSPEMPQPVHRLAAEHHKARRLDCPHREAVT